MVHQQILTFQTKARQTLNISSAIEQIIADSGIKTGICQVFIHHTSASLIITENADPDVRHDLEGFMKKLVKDGDPDYLHDTEGPDDMSAHIRTILTDTSINIPVTGGHSGLGTWQGIFIWEHRAYAHQRKITATVTGE